MYYIFLENEKLNGAGQCKRLDCENIETTQEIYEDYIKTPNKYIYQDNEIVINPNYEKEEKQKEIERVGNLTMTALDFINFLRSKGLSLEVIRAFLDNNIELDTQLKYCQNVYCGVACSIMPITLDGITITKEDVIEAFKNKHGENIEITQEVEEDLEL